jgi:hypothetical protein
MEKPADERRDAATVVNEVMEDWLFQTPVIVAKSEPAKRRRPDAKPAAGHRSIQATYGRSFNRLLTDAKQGRYAFMTCTIPSQARSSSRAKT